MQEGLVLEQHALDECNVGLLRSAIFNIYKIVHQVAASSIHVYKAEAYRNARSSKEQQVPRLNTNLSTA